MPSYNTYTGQPMQGNQYAFLNQMQQQIPQQSQQQLPPYAPTLFPQPNGSVYNINNTLEVANVPAGAGLTVALCLSEGLMYIKSMQNGTPMFWAYRITPYDNKTPITQNTSSNITSTEDNEEDKYAIEIESLAKRIENLEACLSKVPTINGQPVLNTVPVKANGGKETK